MSEDMMAMTFMLAMMATTATTVAPSTLPQQEPIVAPLSEKECQLKSHVAETTPAPVVMAKIFAAILSLKTSDARPVVERISKDLDLALRRLFETDLRKISKLEQFYGTLYFLTKYKTIRDATIDFDRKSVYDLLLSSRVFSEPQIPEQVKAVRVTWDRRIEQAAFEVDFLSPEVRLRLNGGKGFSSFKEGLCQTARELRFYGGFRFVIDQNKKDHIFVSKFQDVDLYGTFGSRGLVNVDINFVSLKSVEFLAGSPLGIVKAKVSKREWEVNSHSLLLKLVASFVTDKSIQPIDW